MRIEPGTEKPPKRPPKRSPEKPREKEPEKEPEQETSIEEPGLPYLPSTLDPEIDLPELVLTGVTIDDEEWTSSDHGDSPVRQPDKAPRKPDDILRAPDAPPAGASSEWQTICATGMAFLDLGAGSDATPKSVRRSADRAAREFRASLGDFLTYSKAGLRADVEATDPTRLEAFDLLFDDALVRLQLDEWCDARRQSPPEWSHIAETLEELRSDLERLHRAISKMYGSMNVIEPAALFTFEAIAREIGRQASEHVGGARIDYGEPFDGAMFAIRLASPTEFVVESACTKVDALLGQRSGPGGVVRLSGWVRDSLKVAKLPPPRSGDWQKGLENAADDWITEARKTKAATVGALAQATDDLQTALATARKGVAAAAGGSPRTATRTLDALAEAVARALEHLQPTLGVAGLAKLAPRITALRATRAAVPVATAPWSTYWSTRKAAGLAHLKSAERQKLDRWFSQGLSGALDDLSSQLAKVPYHDHYKLLDLSWKVTNRLNRYRVGIVRQVSDPAARAPLFDAMDAVAAAVSAALQSRASQAKQYGIEL